MSIRSLDMQVMLPRVDQNFHARQTIVNKNANEQANFVQIHDKEIKQKLNTVSELEEGSKADYLKREKQQQHSREFEQGFGSDFKEEPEHFQEELLAVNDKNYNAEGKRTHFGAKILDIKI